MKIKITKIEGFDGVILHPSLDIKDNILVLGFRYKSKSGKDENIFLVVRDGNIELIEGSDYVGKDGKNYFIETKNRLLIRIDERWNREEINRFVEDYNGLKPETVPKANALYQDVKNTLKRYIELDQEIDYALIAAWIIGTYFFPAFSVYPFLNAKAQKGSGKSQFLNLLRQLSFNAKKIRPTLAALGDIIDALRGTCIIDQADSLSNEKNEELLEILTDSYKKGGGNRGVLNLDKGKRNVLEFGTYSPKAFATIKELHEDLRDRCLIVPLIKSKKNFPDANEDSPLWLQLRGDCYRFLIANYTDIESKYIALRASYNRSNEIVGRHAELWLIFETMLRCLGAGEDDIMAGRNRFLSQYKFMEAEPSEFDAAIIEAVLNKMESEKKIILSPKSIGEMVGGEHFDFNATDRQRANLVGWAIKRMNLASEKKRTKEGVAYLFTREMIERIRDAYFPAPATPDATAPENAVEAGGVGLGVGL
jgi:hypothetical protein